MKKVKTLFDAVQDVDNYTVTENGRLANKTTLSACLDFFGSAAHYRNSPKGAVELFKQAYLEDKLTAVKTLFYFRDIRGIGIGMGERDIFRACFAELTKLDPEWSRYLIHLVPFYGRWDDLFGYTSDGVSVFMDCPESVRKDIATLISVQLKRDLNNAATDPTKVSLLAKWMPSCNTSSKRTVALSAMLRKYIMYIESEAVYRKSLSLLRKTIDVLERRLSSKDYTFDYSKIPGKAALKYAAAFKRNDNTRYSRYQDELTKALAEGRKDVKFNASTLYPYEIIEKVNNSELCYACVTPKLSDQEVDNMWRSLPNYISGSVAGKNILVVGDTSGSMLNYNARPMTVACSLCMYISSRNTGIFKDKFILFSDHPEFVTLDSSWPVRQQVDTYINKGFMCNNTDIDKVFRLILDAAVAHDLPESQMPEMLIIVSDMQFDASTKYNERQVDTMKSMYAKSGYKLPKVVYWDVAQNSYGNMPVTVNDKGVCLVNGCKPGLLEMVLSGSDPQDFMLKVLENERYNKIMLPE